jgi:predicted phosphoribosyltransferase
VGQWYERFDQITDGEVVGLLRAAAARSEADDGRGRP